MQRVQKKIERSLSRRSTASSGSRWTPTVMRRLPALKRPPSDRRSEAEPARAEAGGEAGADGAKCSPAETRSTTCSHTTDDSGESAKGELDDADGAKMEAVAADAIRAIHAYGRGDADRARAGPPGPNVELGLAAAAVTDHAALVRSWRLSFSPTPDQEGRSPGGGVQTPTGQALATDHAALMRAWRRSSERSPPCRSSGGSSAGDASDGTATKEGGAGGASGPERV